jgi:uncharacterized small protein (DUF1192 family)
LQELGNANRKLA